MGHTDQRLSILQFSAGDRSLGGIVRAAMHPVVLGADSHAISGDWCGIAMAELGTRARSEEHTSELQSLMRISYAVFCLKKKNIMTQETPTYLLSLNRPSHYDI